MKTIDGAALRNAVASVTARVTAGMAAPSSVPDTWMLRVPWHREPLPAPADDVTFDVPAFARDYRFDETTLGTRARRAAWRAGARALDDLHGRSARELRLDRDEGRDLLALIEEVRAGGPELQEGLTGTLDSALPHLPPRLRQVLLMRFGDNGEAPMTLKAVALRFDLTRERIRQMERAALGKLRVLAGASFRPSAPRAGVPRRRRSRVALGGVARSRGTV
jgi:RNA polymerase sigma factor (sigma-70 family)